MLRSRGYRLGERLVANGTQLANPQYALERRRGTERRLNPIPYFAEYSGHKAHFDQNEKLVHYGVTHVCAVDGYSKKIVGFASMPVKNNITIYNEVYRPMVLRYGLFDQIRVDHGKEFYLTLYQQDNLAQFRRNTSRRPFIQTPSTLNHAVERLWVEVNARINYPIKRALSELVEDDNIDMTCEYTKSCVSEFSLRVCKYGISNFINAWNNHTIRNKGVPNELFRQTCSTVPVTAIMLPERHILATDYNNHGGALTSFSQFGIQPLDDASRTLRDTIFSAQYPSLNLLMSVAANGNTQPFQSALLEFINMTERLS